MSRIDQILEDCLQAIEHGDAIETVLTRYPAYADALRPILEAAISAKNKTLFMVPAEVVRRNRARLLQHAAEMGERRVKRRSSTIWFVAFRRVAVTLTVLGIVFASGTSLVRASSSTVPGDNLYPFKRTWENMLVLITFNTQQREYLELEHENERLEEMQELFEQGRSAPVDFSGLITAQNGDQWIVAGINVFISQETTLPAHAVLIGAEVRVVGRAQNGFVQAQRIELLSRNDAIPTLETSSSNNFGSNMTPTSQIAVSSTSVPESTETNSSETNDIQSTSFKGIVQSMNGNIWMITGVKVDVSGAEISGVVAVGLVAKVEGYVGTNGIIIAQRIELPENNSGSDNTTSNDSDSNSSPEHISPTSTRGEYHEGGDDSEHESEQHEPTETPEPEH